MPYDIAVPDASSVSARMSDVFGTYGTIPRPGSAHKVIKNIAALAIDHRIKRIRLRTARSFVLMYPAMNTTIDEAMSSAWDKSWLMTNAGKYWNVFKSVLKRQPAAL